MRLWGRGVTLRGLVSGAAVAGTRRMQVRAGEFIASRIDARNGAFGLIPEELDGAVVTNDFPVFVVDERCLLPEYLHWLSKTPDFVDACKAASEGTTNRVRLKEDRFLQIDIRLPTLDVQLHIVNKIARLTAKIIEARKLRQTSAGLTERLLVTALSNFFMYTEDSELPSSWEWHRFPDIVEPINGMTTGPFGTLLSKSDVGQEKTGVPVFGIANVGHGKFVPGFVDYISDAKATELALYRLREGDIVTARSGTVGRSCVVPPGLEPSPVMSSNLIRIRVNKARFEPHLFCRLMNGSHLIEHHKSRYCRGSSREFFTQKILNLLYLPTPPIHEQQRILAYLDNLQIKCDALKSLQAGTATLFSALAAAILEHSLLKGDIDQRQLFVT